MVDLKGKKILMFSPYGATKHYGEAINEELINRGAIVKGYDERPSQKAFTKIVIRLFKKKVPRIFNNYINRVIADNKDIAFDYILICRGEAFTPYTIVLLRDAFPNAKIVLYLWDILRCADVKDIIRKCDKAMSFDPQDVEENEGLEFRPTFYVKEYTKVKELTSKKYDCIFIGTLHSNRYKQISFLEKSLKAQGINLYSYLYIPSLLVYIKDFIFKFPYINIKKVHFNPISLGGTIEVLNDSKSVLDINYTAQKSLSTRAYEAMAARRKYITTNYEIKNYDFYNPQNIAVIDLKDPKLPKGFINSPFIPVHESFFRKYSVEGLVDDLFADFI